MKVLLSEMDASKEREAAAARELDKALQQLREARDDADALRINAKSNAAKQLCA